MKFGTAKRTFEFTVEKSETFTIHRPRKIAQWCNGCRSEVEMSKPEYAAKITGISTRKIYSDIEDGTTHYTESADGSLMVCLRSIAKDQASPKLSEGELEQP